MGNTKFVRQIKTEDIEAELHQLSRDPFRRELAKLLGNAPSDDALTRIAERNPDRWAQALAILGKLAGFSDKLEVQANVHAQLSSMSDSELEQRLRDLERQVVPAAAEPVPRPRRRRQPKRELVLIKEPKADVGE